MKTKGLHISQNTYLPKLITSLRAKGINVDTMLRKSKLSHFSLGNENHYIPSTYLYNFLEQVQRSQGLYSIAGQFHKEFSLFGAGDFGDSLFNAPTLLQQAQGAAKFGHLLRTDNILSYSIQGDTFEFTFHLLEKNQSYSSILADIALAQVIDGFRYTCGEHWLPTEIYSTSKSLKRMEKLLGKGNFKLYCNQKVNKVRFPLKFALMELHPNESTLEFNNDSNLTLTKQITYLMKNCAPGKQLSLNQLAEISNLSPRTIHRQLALEGTAYKEIFLNDVLAKSTHLLKNTNNSVKEISQYLGYSESTNFTRAFKNMVNMSPELYRAQA